VCINGEEIEVIVSDITSEFISYKKCNNIDGPKYSIEKSKVFIIKYKNGSKEIINNLNEPIISTLKKKKEIHGKLYFGFEIHYDEALNSKNYNQFYQNQTYSVIRSSMVCSSFLINYKVSKVYEIDLSLGVGLARLIYQTQINDNQGTNTTYLTNKNTSDAYNNYYNYNYRRMAVLNIGARINYLNLFGSQERRINPFIKPEISIMQKAGHSLIISYSAILGVNFNKRMSFSIGYKYTPLKTTTERYTYNGWGQLESKQIVDNSVIGFHNLVGKVSFEF
jgi:hypothetical protein